MTDYLTIRSFSLYIIVLLVLVVVAVVLHLIKRNRFSSMSLLFANLDISRFLFESISFSFLGLTLGYLIGLSRNSIVDAFLPAFFTFLSGFVIFLFSKRKDGLKAFSSLRDRILLILLSLSITVYMGASEGGYIRIKAEEDALKMKHLMELEKMEMEFLIKVDQEILKKDSFKFIYGRSNYKTLYDRYYFEEDSITYQELEIKFSKD